MMPTMWLFLFLGILAGSLVSVDACTPFTYKDWHGWGECTAECAGGLRIRYRYYCHFNTEDSQIQGCNEHCYYGGEFFGLGGCWCNAWRYGTCCENCDYSYYIQNCNYYWTRCNDWSYPYDTYCGWCQDPYYPSGSGCAVCPSIDHCPSWRCSTYYDSTCYYCDFNNYLFKLTDGNTKCSHMCSWNNHYCWPGYCSDDTKDSCVCDDGFEKVSDGDSGTTCQLAGSNVAEIETCFTTMKSSSGDMASASWGDGSSTGCAWLQDFYSNFVPTTVSFELYVTFTTTWTSPQPAYIAYTEFGLTDVSMAAFHNSVNGQSTKVGSTEFSVGSNYQADLKPTYSLDTEVTISPVILTDGDQLCAYYTAYAGGYLQYYDLYYAPSTHSAPVPYDTTARQKVLCYRYDITSPRHCADNAACSDQPVLIADRIINTNTNLEVYFRRWYDPVPSGMSDDYASGIESYELTLHEVMSSGSVLQVSTSVVASQLVTTDSNPVYFSVASSNPKLYAVYLTVKDVANNVRQSRAFALYDGSSYITSTTAYPFYVESAVEDSGYMWQTSYGSVCLNWVNHFYNVFYYYNPLLNPIQADPHGIAGAYDQQTGDLPVSGTPNVDGIVGFNFRYDINGGSISSSSAVPNFLTQKYCHSFDTTDGYSYTLYIDAHDIAGHTYEENRTVHYDSSVPEISNFYLVKDGVHWLFVHDRTDLSTMNLHIEVKDAHSGIDTIFWEFGISAPALTLTDGYIDVDTIEGDCPTNISDIKCYCPSVGLCELYDYILPLNKLVSLNKHNGDHNRNYFFEVTVWNTALLYYTMRIDILVDESPPETGVVHEGPVDEVDIDYTSEDTFMVQWHGFIDHESDIKEYHIAIAPRCLNAEEMANLSLVDNLEEHLVVDHPETSARLQANFTGKMFTTMVAMNNAMDPSYPVCSDGITRDVTAPRLEDVIVRNGRWSESLLCWDSRAWILTEDMSKVLLNDTTVCQTRCAMSVNTDAFPAAVPTTVLVNVDEELSDLKCDSLPSYSNDETIVYLPDDQIHLEWRIDEDGSQIDDFHVGFGMDASEEMAPGHVGYVTAKKKLYFDRHHIGISSSQLFYMFLKADSKSGLTTIATIGPLLIDESPPLARETPEVVIEDPYIMTQWNNDTFYDLEQSESIHQVYYQFVTGNSAVTPLTEWREEDSSQCPGHDGPCIKYGLSKLQEYDTEAGYQFYVALYVHNRAGHVLEVKTALFRIPSNYPPGNAILFDVDPDGEYSEDGMDVNVHFSEETLCAKWIGFRHHESITIEIGVGSSTETDDVVAFTEVEDTGTACVTSALLLPSVKYHALVRASCSGGQTTAVSNGVTILTQAYVDSFLTVRVGRQCTTSPDVVQLNQITAQGGTSEAYVISTKDSLEVGKSYNVYLPDNATISIDQNEGELTLLGDEYLGVIFYSVVPYVHNPVLIMLPGNNFTVSDFDKVKVVRCPNSEFTHLENDAEESWWYFTTGDIFASTFETGFIFVSEDFGVSRFLEGRVSAFQHTTITKSSNPIPSGFEPGSTYRMGVRACVGDRCLEPALSDSFVFVFEPPVGYIRTADITFEPGTSCVNVDIKWDAFTGESPVKFYQWTLSEDELATKLVIEWNTTSPQQLQVNECLVLPHNLYRTLYACVSAYTEGEQASTMCKGLRSTSFGAFSTNIVYDVDTSAENWDDIKSMIATSNLGQMYSVLHDSELDLSTTSGKVAGVIMYGTERTIDWFLMETAEIPDVPGFYCSEYYGCLGSGSNMDGYMEFNTTGLSRNTLYHICAKSEETSIVREFFTETLEELNTCSDGFALDDQPPTCSGKLHVTSATDGYLTDVTHVVFSWDACHDNNDAKALGYIDNIKSYSYAVGRRPGGDDIVEFTDVGLSKVAKLSMSGVPDGSLVYISVKAKDHAGLSASMTSQELTAETSAPSAGALLLNQRYDTKYISTGLLNVRPVEFHDEHTGIYKYQISVGSAFNADDILATTEFTEDNFNFEISDNDTSDGLRSVITVKAINRAGLVSEAVTTVCIYDTSPPITGNVQDGDKEEDVDFQTDVYAIKGHWGTSGGFDDPHSGIQSYSVGLGSEPYDDDIEQMTSVGSHTEMTWHRKFRPGQWYYITVEACNYAGLCTRKASNGIVLDNSPPIHGLVRVGSSSQHQNYIPRNSSVHVYWVGFEDPQSGMERFETCVGTAPGDCNVVPKFSCLLQSNILKTGLTLPVNSDLYATVFAYNKVGMWVQQSSNVFRVDDSAPVLVSPPSFIQDHKSFPGFSAQPEPSLLSLSWQFDDNESPVYEHTITLKTHHEGHTPIETVLLGNENSLTMFFDADNWLKSGDRYYVVVTACNAAGHCTSAQTEDLLIDSSPPHLGGFGYTQLYRTDTGINSNITLSWYGFHDQESDVLNYFITVSESYSGDELTDGVVVEPHNSSSTDQATTITLSHGYQVTHGGMLVLSIWAQNHAGLTSSIARVSVFAFAMSTPFGTDTIERGFLDIEMHSCDVHYCNDDCTCAVVERPCVLLEGGDGNCVSYNNVTHVQDANYPVINVYGGLAGNVQTKTASSACLAGHWEKAWTMSRAIQHILRYEWSMGLLNEPVGFGVFDLTKEIPWNDVGDRKEIVHCLNSGEPLLHGNSYVIYTRAWYSENVSAIFQSTPINVDHTAPNVLRGRFVKDSDSGCVDDYDFIDWQDTITACWTNVFLEEESDITHFTAALGTSPNADDVQSLANVGLNTTWTLTGLSLSAGTKYYFSVTAYNSLGRHTALASDGFVIDVDKPTDGVVYTSGPYQSSNDSFFLSWHGFVDHFSGLLTYHAAVAEEGTVDDESSLVFTDVGLHNAYTLTNLNLIHGSKYIGAVKTVDTAGHESDVTFSQATTIDTTPPEGYKCDSYDEVYSESVNCSSKGTYRITGPVLLSSDRFYTVVGSMEDLGTAEMSVDKLDVNVPMKIAHDGSSTFQYTFCAQQSTETTLTITGECQPDTGVSAQLSICNSQLTSVDKALAVKQIASFTLQATIMVHDVESKIQKLWLGLGTKFGGFQLKALDEVYHGDDGEIYVDAKHGSVVYATLIAENHAGLRSVFRAAPVTMDASAPEFVGTPWLLIEDVTNITQAALVTWEVDDAESGVAKCFCGIGYQQSADDIHSFSPADNTSSCRLEFPSLQHGDVVYATVLCVNDVELSAEASSRPITVTEEAPSGESVQLSIKPSNTDSTRTALRNPLLPVQSNLASMKLEWLGFADDIEIDRFEYCLKQGNVVVRGDTSVERQTMARIDGLGLQSDQVYRVEVAAVSQGDIKSDPVSANVLLLGSGPRHTGNQISKSVYGANLEYINLDWSGVFNVHVNATVSYSLDVGSKKGCDDVISNLVTSGTSHSFKNPGSTLLSTIVQELHVVLTATYDTGKFTSYRATQKLSV